MRHVKVHEGNDDDDGKNEIREDSAPVLDQERHEKKAEIKDRDETKYVIDGQMLGEILGFPEKIQKDPVQDLPQGQGGEEDQEETVMVVMFPAFLQEQDDEAEERQE
jgi:nitric oxide reductase activation protein